jgi:hypothetical protein
MSDFNPLLPSNRQADADGRSEGFCVSEFSVFKKLTALNQSKAGGPDGIPNWILKENAEILATTMADIINTSYNEGRLPSSWKFANIIPVPKAKPVREVNKDLRSTPNFLDNNLVEDCRRLCCQPLCQTSGPEENRS